MMIRELRRHFPARIPEWWNSAVLFAWGCYTLVHPGVFEQPYLQGLVHVAPTPTPEAAERFWGMIAIMVGMLRGCALFVNGSFTRTPLIRVVASLISAFVWAQIVSGILATGIPAHGLIMYSGTLSLDLISAYRAAIDTGIAEATRRAEKSGGSERAGFLKAGS